MKVLTRTYRIYREKDKPGWFVHRVQTHRTNRGLWAMGDCTLHYTTLESAKIESAAWAKF